MDAYQTTIYTAVLISGSIIVIIFTYFGISIYRQHRHIQNLQKSKILAEIKTLEKERSRMATDLHDELGPLLSSVKMRMNLLDILSADDQQELEKINEHIDNIIKRMREISNDLMPSTLMRKGLIAGIEDSIRIASLPDGLVIKFRHTNVSDISKEQSIHIYRIVQEIIHNTIKHAGASTLNIHLSSKNGKLILTSTDNGVGFDHTRLLQESGGLGLRSLLSRTEVMNGEMYINSRKNKGTEYTFEIPI
jgi:signal transduction histidine kinase